MVSLARFHTQEINMSATLEHTASPTLAFKPDVTLGAALGKAFAFARGVLADTSAYEIIEGGALMAVFAAATVFTLGAFGLHIGAN
jgi:hypothetical protein